MMRSFQTVGSFVVNLLYHKFRQLLSLIHILLLSQCIDGRVDPGEYLLDGSKQAAFPIQTYLMSDQPVVPHPRVYLMIAVTSEAMKLPFLP